jgi:hypothetical protein
MRRQFITSFLCGVLVAGVVIPPMTTFGSNEIFPAECAQSPDCTARVNCFRGADVCPDKPDGTECHCRPNDDDTACICK